MYYLFYPLKELHPTVLYSDHLPGFPSLSIALTLILRPLQHPVTFLSLRLAGVEYLLLSSSYVAITE